MRRRVAAKPAGWPHIPNFEFRGKDTRKGMGRGEKGKRRRKDEKRREIRRREEIEGKDEREEKGRGGKETRIYGEGRRGRGVGGGKSSSCMAKNS